MKSGRAVVVRCEHASDGPLCAVIAEDFARQSGLSRIACQALATSVAELVGNALRHAGAGELTLRRIGVPVSAVEVVVCDQGPGIADVELAMTDGWSRGRLLEPHAPRTDGLGMGLGAVRRLMDELSIASSHAGTTVVARKRIGGF